MGESPGDTWWNGASQILRPLCAVVEWGVGYWGEAMGCCSWVKSMDQQYVGILLLFTTLLIHKSGLLSCKLSVPKSEHKRSSRGHFCGLLYPSCMRRGLINIKPYLYMICDFDY